MVAVTGAAQRLGAVRVLQCISAALCSFTPRGCMARVKSGVVMLRKASARLLHHLVIILMSGSCSHGPKHH